MNLRDELYKKARSSKSEDDWIIAKQHRNIVNSMCKIAKRDHIQSKITKNSENPSKFWKEINKIWGSKKTDNDNTITLQDEETGKQVNENKTANFLNKYFSSIGDKLQHKIKPLNTEERHKLYDQHLTTTRPTTTSQDIHNEEFKFNLINTEELQLAIGKIENHKNSGIKSFQATCSKQA